MALTKLSDVPNCILDLHAGGRFLTPWTPTAFSDAGVTACTDRATIRQWNDTSGAGNNVSQATAASRPKFLTSPSARTPRAQIETPLDVTSSPGTLTEQWMDLPAITFDKQAFSFFCVCDLVDATRVLATLIGCGTTSSFLTPMFGTEVPGGGAAPFPLTVYGGGVSRASTLFPHCSPEVYGFRCSASAVRMYMGSAFQDFAALPAGTDTGGSLMRWSGSPGTRRAYGNHYAEGAYSRAVTDQEASDIIAYLSESCGIASKTVQVFTAGDSITLGSGNSDNQFWPRLLNLPPNACYRMASLGGRTIDDLQAKFATEVTPFLSSALTSIYVLFAGTNNFAPLPQGDTGAQAYAKFVTLCMTARAAGCKVVAVTPISRSTGAPWRTHADTFIASLAANWTTFADALVRLDLDPRIGSSTAYGNDVAANPSQAMFQTGGIHPTNAGQGVIAENISLALSLRSLRPIARAMNAMGIGIGVA